MTSGLRCKYESERLREVRIARDVLGLREIDRPAVADDAVLVVGSRRAVMFVAKLNRDDLRFLGGLLADGTVKPVIERRYPLAEMPEALSYLGQGHARGKLVITA